jgi:hypothetical protein
MVYLPQAAKLHLQFLDWIEIKIILGSDNLQYVKILAHSFEDPVITILQKKLLNQFHLLSILTTVYIITLNFCTALGDGLRAVLGKAAWPRISYRKNMVT